MRCRRARRRGRESDRRETRSRSRRATRTPARARAASPHRSPKTKTPPRGGAAFASSERLVPVQADTDGARRHAIGQAIVRALDEAALKIDREVAGTHHLVADTTHDCRTVRTAVLEVVVIGLQVREANAALDPELRREPELARDHQHVLAEHDVAVLTSGIDLHGLRVDLSFTHQREARSDEAADVSIDLERGGVVVAVVAARDLAAGVVHAAKADAETP